MQQTAPQTEEKPTITTAEIRSFLQKNPNFFMDNSDVLSEMVIPHDGGGNVTSFHDFQVKKLKQKVSHLEERNKLLIQTSLSNHQSTLEINNLVLELMSAGSLPQLEKVLETSLKNQMSIDHVTLNLDSSITSFENETSVQLRTVTNEEMCSIHGVEGSKVKSDALIHLKVDELSFGLLILGSEDSTRFHCGQGTEILEFLGQVLSLCLLKLES